SRRRSRVLLLPNLLDLVLTQNRSLEPGLARDRRIVDRNTHALEQRGIDRIAVEGRCRRCIATAARTSKEGVFLVGRFDSLHASLGGLNTPPNLVLCSRKHHALVEVGSIESSPAWKLLCPNGKISRQVSDGATWIIERNNPSISAHRAAVY